ncbi:MAG TPA: hypothetical protein VKU60_02580, partial [Chloroflexota bacterium]|nr:hypothetical protein [Chloroflexota bacterium]
MTLVGSSTLRTEDAALLIGAQQFLDDMGLPGVAHAAMLRSPLAHGRITRISTEAAVALPGVLGVLTGEDVVRETKPQRGRVPL